MKFRKELLSIFDEFQINHQTLTLFQQSPYLRKSDSEEYHKLMNQQEMLALKMGSQCLTLFSQALFSQVSDHHQLLEYFMKQLSITEDDSQVLDDTQELTSQSPDQQTSQSPNDLDIEETHELPDNSNYLKTEPDDLNDVSDSESTNSDPITTPIPPVEIIAQHTGRSITLPEVIGEPIDLSAIWQHRFTGTFTEEISIVKELIPLEKRLIKRLKELSAPTAINNTSQFNQSFSCIQSIADANYIKYWSHWGDRLAKTLCQFTIYYTRYLLSLPYHLRPNGMTGDNSYTKLIQRVGKSAHQWGFEINGLKSSDSPKNNFWLQDTEDRYWMIKEIIKELNQQQEHFNGDREIDRLNQMIQNQEDDDIIIDQVTKILNQTDINAQDQRLAKLLVNYLEVLDGPIFKNLRSKIREYIICLETEEITTTQLAHLEIFANKKLVILGGDRRHDATLYLQSILPESVNIDWLDISSSNGPNARESLIKSIENSGVDALIIIKRFISHGVTVPIKQSLKEHPDCKSSMAKGYGKAQLRSALEFITEQWAT